MLKGFYQFDETFALNESIPAWVADCARITLSYLLEDRFPCYYAKMAIERRAAFASYLNSEDLTLPLILATSLREFLNKKISPKNLPVFIVFIKTNVDSLDKTKVVFWKLLEDLGGCSVPVEHIQPNDSQWTFTFDRAPLFINGHSRFYKNKRSRWSAADLMLVLQPVANLEFLADSEAKAQEISSIIRKRVCTFDGSTVGPEFGKHFLDWKTSYAAQ